MYKYSRDQASSFSAFHSVCRLHPSWRHDKLRWLQKSICSHFQQSRFDDCEFPALCSIHRNTQTWSRHRWGRFFGHCDSKRRQRFTVLLRGARGLDTGRFRWTHQAGISAVFVDHRQLRILEPLRPEPHYRRTDFSHSSSGRIGRIPCSGMEFCCWSVPCIWRR